MRVYGFQITDTGLEFSAREDRDKAINAFLRCSTVKISNTGLRYEEHSTPFGTYERETKEQLANCDLCHGVFSIETCPSREYPRKNSWEKDYSTTTGHVCDACLAAREHEKTVFDAKKILHVED